MLKKVVEHKKEELENLLTVIGFSQVSDSLYQGSEPELIKSVLNETKFIENIKNA